jgi:hypothetical protein
MPGLDQMLEVLLSTLRDIFPIAVVLTVFQFFILKRPVPNPHQVLLGFLYVVIGLTLFLLGLELALFPVGRTMASQFTDPAFLGTENSLGGEAHHWMAYLWLYLFAFCIGFSTTIAEPALIAVATKAHALSGGTIGAWGLRLAVAVGVGLGITLGVYRIVLGVPIHYFIITGYIVVVVQTFFAPRSIVPLAYDSGGVTTSTVTVPLVAALGLGLAENIPGRTALIDGFGLIAFASLFPIISVMAYAQISDWRVRKSISTQLQRSADNNHESSEGEYT